MRKLSNNSNSNSNTYLTTNKDEKALGTLISNQMLGLLARMSGFKERSVTGQSLALFKSF